MITTTTIILIMKMSMLQTITNINDASKNLVTGWFRSGWEYAHDLACWHNIQTLDAVDW